MHIGCGERGIEAENGLAPNGHGVFIQNTFELRVSESADFSVKFARDEFARDEFARDEFARDEFARDKGLGLH